MECDKCRIDFTICIKSNNGYLQADHRVRRRGDAWQFSAAARAEGVTPAIVGRRLDALEARLGVKLMLRTTRKLTLTFEGEAFLEDCQRILNDLANAEAAVSLGGVRASGHLRCRRRPVSDAATSHRRLAPSCAPTRK